MFENRSFEAKNCVFELDYQKMKLATLHSLQQMEAKTSAGVETH